jgi:hypothetical protein
MNVTIRTPPNLRFDSCGERTFKNTGEWLTAVKDAIVAEFDYIEWVSTDDQVRKMDTLINTDLVVGVYSGASEGYKVSLVSATRSGSTTLLTVKTLSGIHEAMDIANWLTVALNRYKSNLHVVSCDPAQNMEIT